MHSTTIQTLRIGALITVGTISMFPCRLTSLEARVTALVVAPILTLTIRTDRGLLQEVRRGKIPMAGV